MKFIDLERQYQAYKDELDKAVADVMASCQFIMGPKVEEIEERLAAFTNANHAIAVSSGTDALLLALLAKEVGPGDVVVTTPFTFVATAEVISLAGAIPLFVDIEPDTFNMDPELLDEALAHAERKGLPVKGIIPVSMFGVCPDMDRLGEIAQRHGCFLLEDACQSMGASFKGRRSCALSELAATSFFPSKPLGAYGDGGMVFCEDEAVAQRISALRLHGETARYQHQWIGTNARLDALQAAVLLVKLSHFEEELSLRQQAADRYLALLDQSGLLERGVEPQKVPEGCISAWAQFTIRIPDSSRAEDSSTRDAVAKTLAEMGIPTAIHYPKPIHLQPAFSYLGLKEGSLPVAEKACREVLSLPIHPFIRQEEQEMVVEALAQAL